MKVTERDVLHVAELANLELTEAERARMLRDLNNILGYVERLNELDTAKVPPMAQIASADKNRDDMRADEPRPSISHEAALKNAPDADGTYFIVPKVIER